jgi:hypothetical protein
MKQTIGTEIVTERGTGSESVAGIGMKGIGIEKEIEIGVSGQERGREKE